MQASDFLAELSRLTTGFTPVVDPIYGAEVYRFLDLSTSNTIIDSVDTSSAEAIAIYIDTYLSKTGGKVAYGGYLEKRSIYDRSLYFGTPPRYLPVCNRYPRGCSVLIKCLRRPEGLPCWCLFRLV